MAAAVGVTSDVLDRVDALSNAAVDAINYRYSSWSYTRSNRGVK